MNIKNLLVLLVLYTITIVSNAATIKAVDITTLNNAISKAIPGDTIMMVAGEWKDTKIVFENNGTAANPIVIIAEFPGKTILTGNSSIKFAGNYLVVQGIWFTNGYSENAVIEFRKNDKLLANNCRITNCAIDNFSKPDRFNSDSWIIFWGKHNRIDHCTIGDKLNCGPTLIVNLNDERDQQNFHIIDSNHFNKHSPLGSNGGETIRVGVARYSLTSSNTVIEHNYFEHCSGEVEIISVKSCYNKVNHNTFYECEGGLVLRHGNHNEVSGNLFIGNNKPHTGGIRVINPEHTIENNLMLNCSGVRFRAALSVMNGVPNSQVNRYYQVKDSKIQYNSFINCASIVFGAGKDNERKAAPQNVGFNHNFIFTHSSLPYEDLNNDGGMLYQSNVVNITYNIAVHKVELSKGFATAPTKVIEWNGLHFDYPIDNNAGADLTKVAFVQKNKTGASWFNLKLNNYRKGNIIKVSAIQSKNLPNIVASAAINDTILLTDSGLYKIESTIFINKPLSIISVGKSQLVNVAEKTLTAFMSIENGGSLFIKGVLFNSAYQSFGDVESAIATTTKNMVQHYTLKMLDCECFNFNENNYACFKASKSTFGDSVVFDHCIFRNMSGAAIDLSAEKEDKGIYNAEIVMVRNCVFTNMLAGAINVYRGGNDESTTGPFVTIDHCVFNDVDNREQGCVVKLLGVQYARVINSVFNNCGKGGRAVWFEELGWDNVKVDYCNFFNAGRVESFQGKLFGNNNLQLNPLFTREDNLDFTLQIASPLIHKAMDKNNIGLQ